MKIEDLYSVVEALKSIGNTLVVIADQLIKMNARADKEETDRYKAIRRSF